MWSGWNMDMSPRTLVCVTSPYNIWVSFLVRLEFLTIGWNIRVWMVGF